MKKKAFKINNGLWCISKYPTKSLLRSIFKSKISRSTRDIYSNSPANDPKGPSSGSDRVSRGGSWNNYDTFSRTAYRYDISPGFRRAFLGFRLARTR